MTERLSDVRAAAERLRRIQNGESVEAVYAQPYTLEHQVSQYDHPYHADLRWALGQLLALIHADDAESLSEDWLRSVGFECDRADNWRAEMSLPEFCHPDWPDDRTQTSLIIHYDGACFLSQGPDESIQWPVPIKTRGDLRLLCRALQVPLKESS